MSVIGILLGIALGAGLVLAAMRVPQRLGRLGLLLAISAFYLAFAFMEGDMGAAMLHSAVLLLFVGLGFWAWQHSPAALALAIMAHGIFDMVLHASAGHVGPDWWPAFCAAVDISLGLGLLLFDRKSRP